MGGLIPGVASTLSPLFLLFSLFLFFSFFFLRSSSNIYSTLSKHFLSIRISSSFQVHVLNLVCAMLCLVAQCCTTLCEPMDCSLPGSSVHRESPGKNTGVGHYALLQRVFPTWGSNPSLPHCRWYWARREALNLVYLQQNFTYRAHKPKIMF